MGDLMDEGAVGSWRMKLWLNGAGVDRRRAIWPSCAPEGAHLAGFYSLASASLTDPPPPHRHSSSWRFQYWETWTLSEPLPAQLDFHPVFASTLQGPVMREWETWETERPGIWSICIGLRYLGDETRLHANMFPMLHYGNKEFCAVLLACLGVWGVYEYMIHVCMMFVHVQYVCERICVWM